MRNFTTQFSKKAMSNCEQCIVSQVNSLKVLTKDELMRISKCKTTRHIKKGELIFKEGETLNGVYCIKDGICKLSKLSANGKDQIVKLVLKGDLLGQRSLIGNESANLSAIALSDMDVCFIPKAEIIGNLKNNASFSMQIMKQMAQDLKESDNIIVNMAQKSVRQRLAEALIHIDTNFGSNDQGFLKVVLSREDYANIVGTATESAIRVLSQFKKDGLISTSGKQIKIENVSKLKMIE